jgi:outer membrane protein OmpA-like peptidoglycan-associated protein
VLVACPIVGVFRCSTKSAGKFRVLVTAVCLFGGVLDGRVARARGDWELMRQSRVAGQSDAVSLRDRDQVQMQDRKSAGSKPSNAVSQPKSGGVREAPFLKHALLFDPDSAGLSAASRNAVKTGCGMVARARGNSNFHRWFLRFLGSETCTPALAQRRGTVAHQFLVRFGAAPDQIAGVNGWENLNGTRPGGVTECQRQNRSAHLFMAEPAGSLK